MASVNGSVGTQMSMMLNRDRLGQMNFRFCTRGISAIQMGMLRDYNRSPLTSKRQNHKGKSILI